MKHLCFPKNLWLSKDAIARNQIAEKNIVNAMNKVWLAQKIVIV